MRYGKTILICVLTVTMLSGCKVKEAAGAYRPAKAKATTEKKANVKSAEQLAAEEAERQRQAAAREAEAAQQRAEQEAEAARQKAAAEAEAARQREEAEAEAARQQAEAEAKAARAQAEAEAEAARKRAEEEAAKEVTRAEIFTVVAGQENANLKKYHVVIGSFGQQSNAQNLQSRMKPEYQPVIVVNEKGMYRVLLESFDDYASARALITRVATEFPDAWVLIAK